MCSCACTELFIFFELPIVNCLHVYLKMPYAVLFNNPYKLSINSGHIIYLSRIFQMVTFTITIKERLYDLSIYNWCHGRIWLFYYIKIPTYEH